VYGFSVLQGVGQTTSSGTRIQYSNIALSATADITPQAFVTLEGKVSISSNGSSLYAGINILRGVGSLASNCLLETDPIVIVTRFANLSSSSNLTIQPKLTLYGTSTLSTTGTLSALGKYIVSSSVSSTSSLGAEVSLIVYGQVGSTIIIVDRETEEEDLRLTEDDSQRITEDTFSNLITTGAIFNSTLTTFSSIAYVNVKGVWKEFSPFVYYEGAGCSRKNV